LTIELARAHLRSGRAREALVLLEVQVAARPTDTQALFASAIALEDLGRADEALERYSRVLSQSPNFEDALHNRGLLLARLGRLKEAEQCHRQYSTVYPDSRRARFNLTDVLLAQSRYEEAVGELDLVLAKSPLDIPALVNRGMALAALGRFEEARDAFSTAHSHDALALEKYVLHVAPGSDMEVVLSPISIFLWRCCVAQGICDWSGWDRYIAEFRRMIADPSVPVDPALGFAAFHLPLGADERHAVARRIAKLVESRTAPLSPQAPRNRTKLRIGILSPDFREHLNSYLLLPLFELLDRSRFELYAYSLAGDDGSVIRARVKEAADRFSDFAALRDSEAAHRIRDDQVDILVDASGHTTGGRFGITAQRPAPIQALYLGFSGSLGSSRVDYAIVDRIVAPEKVSAEWSEARVYLPNTYYLYDFRDDIPDVAVTRREYGLPEEAFVYCAFHKPEKITPDAFDLWMRILAAVPRSVMWFLALPDAAVANLRRAAKLRGVDPARLHFAPFEPRTGRYLPRQRLGDLMIDALHHNAMTTACDALGAGLPLLTLQGSSIASRAAESLLRAAGVPELVAAGPGDLVEQAVQLATNAGKLARLRAKLQRNRHSAPLFDTTARVRELEAAFTEMWRRQAAGETPASFSVH
jgi:predicted O-linked N-acetylglucosamine transferase (SPINDLY family)